ncbi:signal peptidase II [Flindersiella endophytica]
MPLVVLALDIVTKRLAVAELSDGHMVSLAGGLLKLNLVLNPGAAFGIGTGYTLVLSLLAIGVITVVIVMARKLRSTAWAIALGLLLGGALGNLTDRVFREPGFLRGHVIDFLQLPNWPVFNIADMSVSTAAVLIVLLSLSGRRLDGTIERREPRKPRGSAAADEPVEPVEAAKPGKPAEPTDAAEQAEPAKPKVGEPAE